MPTAWLDQAGRGGSVEAGACKMLNTQDSRDALPDTPVPTRGESKHDADIFWPRSPLLSLSPAPTSSLSGSSLPWVCSLSPPCPLHFSPRCPAEKCLDHLKKDFMTGCRNCVDKWETGSWLQCADPLQLGMEEKRGLCRGMAGSAGESWASKPLKMV